MAPKPPTLEELTQALEQAHAAGDKEGAQDLADAIRDLQAVKPISVGDMVGRATETAGDSFVKLAEDTITPFLHPQETYETVSALGSGIMQKLMSSEAIQKYAGARQNMGAQDERDADVATKVGEFFMKRYGGIDNVMNTIAEDPAGAMADLSTVLTAGAALPARLPGILGTPGKVMRSVGRAADPISLPFKAVAAGAKNIAEPLGSHVVGGMAGIGPDPIREAAAAGMEGGSAGKTFRAHMRGNESARMIVKQMKVALGNMYKERSADYVQSMRQLGLDLQPLDFKPINKALRDISERGIFRGQSGTASPKIVRPDTEGVFNKLADAVNDYREGAPKEFHTVLGMDALKQRVGNILAKQTHGTPEWGMANDLYHAIRGEIVKQSPGYAKVMESYQEASEIATEIARTLSLNPTATVDTALRKLHSILRNNVTTNFGNRRGLADTLTTFGAPDALPALAGQAMNSGMPRGIAGANPTQTGAIAAGAAHLTDNMEFLPALAASSPRLTGEVVHGAARVARPGKLAYDLAERAKLLGYGPRLGTYQGGRLTNELRGRR